MSFQQPEKEVPLQETEAAIPQPNQQNSVLSLTLDEVCGKSGKNLGSMSMDEFIASIWNTEDMQLNPPPPPPPTSDEAAKNKSVAPEATTIPQPGPFSVPSPICKKTVDEVWSQIQKSQPQNNEGKGFDKNETLQKQPTLGEITLEEFLVKAGVVRESTLFTTLLPQNSISNIQNSNIQNNNIQNNVPLNTSYMVIGTTGSDVSSSRVQEPQVLPQNNNLVVRNLTTTSGSAENSQNSGESSGRGRKRIINALPDAVIERRQRRMLKNRESAARSRARRQVL